MYKWVDGSRERERQRRNTKQYLSNISICEIVKRIYWDSSAELRFSAKPQIHYELRELKCLKPDQLNSQRPIDLFTFFLFVVVVVFFNVTFFFFFSLSFVVHFFFTHLKRRNDNERFATPLVKSIKFIWSIGELFPYKIQKWTSNRPNKFGNCWN